MSHGHQIAKITYGSFSPPKVAGTNIWKTALESHEIEGEISQDNTLYVHQPEPKNFKPLASSKLRRKILDDDVDYQERSSRFYSKLIDIKQQQKETLKLLDQLSRADQEFGRKLNQNKELLQKEKQAKITDEELKKPLFDQLKIKKKDRKVEEILKRMWDDFEVDEKKMMEVERTREREVVKGGGGWKPIVTVPRPFNMTIREERRKAEECKKETRKDENTEEVFEHRHRAKSAPATTFIPMYDEINERMNERSRLNRENAYHATMAIQQPFSFDKRDAENKSKKESEITKIKKKEARKIKEMSKFKAKPVNMKVLDSKVYDKVEEEHLYRKIKGRLRKEELFFTSSLPPRMRSNRRKEMERREEKIEKARREQEFSHKPVTSKMPDFDKLHRNEMRRKMIHEETREKREIVQKPFRLSAHERSRSSMTSQSSLDCGAVRPSSVQSYRRYEKAKENPMPTRMSESSRKRMECIRESLSRAQKQIDKYKKQDATNVKLKSEISYNLCATDNDKIARAERNKKELLERQKEYKKFLKDVQLRVDKRPLLLTQQDKKSVESEAERRYNEIMKRELSSPEIHKREIPLFETVESRVDDEIVEEADEKENDEIAEKFLEVTEETGKFQESNQKEEVEELKEENSLAEVPLASAAVAENSSDLIEFSDKNSEVSHETSQFTENSDKNSVRSEVENPGENLETEQVEENNQEKEITEKTEEESITEEEIEKSETETQVESSEKLIEFA